MYKWEENLGEGVWCYVSDDTWDGVADYREGWTALIVRYDSEGEYPYGCERFGDLYRYAKPMDRIMADYQESIENHHSLEPTHTASGLPTDSKERKAIPVYTGFVNYFPRAIAAVAKVSLVGGIQHGQTAETLHWDRSKSGDELDAMMRHVLDGDWEQVAWRAMANLEKKLEADEA
jgi:hypothetical protein